MANAYRLSVGDGVTADSLNLLDTTRHYVLEGGFRAPPPDEDKGFRGIELDLRIVGSTADGLWTNYQAIETKLMQARRARGVYGLGTNVTLGVQLSTTDWVYFDVIEGVLTDLVHLPGNTEAEALLTLVCLPYGRGDAVTEMATATLTNGTGSTWLVTGIKGDVPAPARLTIADVSTGGQVINGVHVYQRSLYELTAGHFDPVVELTVVAPGVATTDSSSYSGSNFARLAANTSWRTIAEATRPAGDFNTGLYDLWLRARDSSAVPGAPGNLEGAAQSEVRVVNTWTNSAAGSATSIAATLDPSPTAGNILIAGVGYEGNTTPTTPTGFTLATDGVDTSLVTNTSPTPDAQVAVYWKVADGTETSVSVTTGTATNRALWVREYAGLTAAPVEQVAADTTGSGTSALASTVTTTQAYQLIVQATYNVSNSAISGWGGGLSEQFDAEGLGVATRLVTSAGSYGSNALYASTGQWAATVVSFKAANSTAPNLTAGTYTIRVVAVSSGGGLSAATAPIQTVVAANQAVPLTWTAPASGSPSDYRVYWDRGLGWNYLEVGSAATAYTLRTESGATAADPDIDGNAMGLFRVQVGLAGGVTLFTGPARAGVLASETWEDVLAGTFPLPPIPALDGDGPPAWLIRVQGKHVDASPNLDVDIAWLAPHDEPQLLAEYTGLDLATPRDWVLDQRRDGRVSGRLYEANTTIDVGQVDTIGQLLIGPGATQLAMRCTVADGVSDVTDAKFVATLRYVPRFRLLRGA